MLNKWIRSARVAACCIALSGCANLTVRTDQNPNLSVAQCHTYAFAKEYVANADQPAAYGNPLNADRLRAAIEANLSARGIERADRAAADCVVGYALGSRQVINDYYGGIGPGWGPGWGYGWGFGGGFYGGGAFGWDYPYVQDETRIAVDVFDAKSHQAIWHASVSQTVSELRGPNAVEKINAAVAAIFSKFPGGAPPVSGARTTT